MQPSLPETTNTQPAAIDAKKIARLTGIVTGIILILTAIFPLLIGFVFMSPSLTSNTRTAQTEATISTITPGVPLSSSGDRVAVPICSYGFTFFVNDKQYSGGSDVQSDKNCNLSPGSTVRVTYDPHDPSNNAGPDDQAFSTLTSVILLSIGGALLVSGVAVLVVTKKIRRSYKPSSNNLADGTMPASNSQLREIERGMQELGQLYTPRSMTQAEAEHTLSQIQNQLAIVRSTKS